MPNARPFVPSRRTCAAIVVAASLGLYLPTLGHGFVIDDVSVVALNPMIRSLRGVPELFRTTEWAGAGVNMPAYRPLTMTTYAVNHALSGGAPWSYHLANVALHALAVLLVFALGVELGLSTAAAGAAALLFGVHPIHVEAVSNVVGRKDVLATVLALSAVLAHRSAIRRGGGWRMAVPAVACAGAMLAKEVGIVAPALIVLADVAAPAHPRGDRIGLRRRLGMYGAYAAVAIAYLALLAWVTRSADATISVVDNVAAHASALQRVMTAIAVLGKGMALQVLPMGQSPDYSYAAIPLVTSAADPRFLGAAAALAGGGALAVVLARRAPVVPFAFAWYLVALLPSSNLLFPSFTIFGERLLYLPSVGSSLLAGAAVAALAARVRPPAVSAALGAAALALSIGTLRYSAAWANQPRLSALAAERVPGSSKAHYGYAVVLLDDGRPKEALDEVDRALAIVQDAQSWTVRAMALQALGRTQEADGSARRAIAIDGENPWANYVLGRLAWGAGRHEEAEVLWRRTVARQPTFAPAWADLSGCRLAAGDLAGAVAMSSRATSLDPRQAGAWYSAGVAWKRLGDAGRARAAFQRFVETAGPERASRAATVRAALARGDLP